MRTASLSSRGFDSSGAGEPDFFPSPPHPCHLQTLKDLPIQSELRHRLPGWNQDTQWLKLLSGESFLFLFLIGGKLFYSVGLVSAIQQGESAISIFLSPLS